MNKQEPGAPLRIGLSRLAPSTTTSTAPPRSTAVLRRTCGCVRRRCPSSCLLRNTTISTMEHRRRGGGSLDRGGGHDHGGLGHDAHLPPFAHVSSTQNIVLQNTPSRYRCFAVSFLSPTCTIVGILARGVSWHPEKTMRKRAYACGVRELLPPHMSGKNRNIWPVLSIVEQFAGFTAG